MAYPYSGGQSIPIYEQPDQATPSASLDFSSLRLPQLDAGQRGLMTTAGAYGLEAFGSLMSSIAAGKRARQIADYNARVIEVNSQAQAQAAEMEAQQYMRQAVIARQDADLAGDAQAWREQRQREQNERILGQTKAIVGASGILMEGSPLAAMEATVRQQGLDLAASQYTARVQQRSADERATQAEYSAAMARYGAGERLRIGRQGASLAREQGDGDYALAGLTRAAGAGLRGLATYQYQSEALRLARARVAAASGGVDTTRSLLSP